MAAFVREVRVTRALGESMKVDVDRLRTEQVKCFQEVGEGIRMLHSDKFGGMRPWYGRDMMIGACRPEWIQEDEFSSTSTLVPDSEDEIDDRFVRSV